jgi:hypothetical protein
MVLPPVQALPVNRFADARVTLCNSNAAGGTPKTRSIAYLASNFETPAGAVFNYEKKISLASQDRQETTLALREVGYLLFARFGSLLAHLLDGQI